MVSRLRCLVGSLSNSYRDRWRRFLHGFYQRCALQRESHSLPLFLLSFLSLESSPPLRLSSDRRHKHRLLSPPHLDASNLELDALPSSPSAHRCDLLSRARIQPRSRVVHFPCFPCGLAVEEDPESEGDSNREGGVRETVSREAPSFRLLLSSSDSKR